VVAAPLQVDPFLHSLFAKKMMAAADTLLKSKAFQQPAQIVEADRRVSGPAQDPPKSLFRSHAISVARDWLVTFTLNLKNR